MSSKTKGGGAIFGDYDNDGDLDLFVPIGSYKSLARDLNVLLRNDRGEFTDVTLAAGLTDSLSTDNALWLDYDRDGNIDLYTGNVNDPTFRNKLYRNTGKGTFTDVTEEAGLDIQFRPEDGGSNGGMAAGDFNNDGWPDLYIGAWNSENRLFLNDGQGGFQDATTDEIGDPGQAFGVAVGNIDNDGNLDIFQAAGGGWREGLQRSLMLLNRGEGRFLDVTEGVGLSALGATLVTGSGLADIDNDGHLDLLTLGPFLFINNGDGTFVNETSRSGISGILIYTLSFGDYDLDGFLDVIFGYEGRYEKYIGGIYRNGTGSVI